LRAFFTLYTIFTLCDYDYHGTANLIDDMTNKIILTILLIQPIASFDYKMVVAA